MIKNDSFETRNSHPEAATETNPQQILVNLFAKSPFIIQ